MEELNTWLQAQATEPLTRVAVVAQLTAWQNKTTPLPVCPNAQIQALVQAQHHLGWHAAFEGRFAIGWASAQEQFYRRINSKVSHSGKQWLSLLIKKLFDISWDMWTYRNDALHDRENGIHIQALRRQVSAEFTKGPQNITCLRLLMQPTEARIKL